MKRKFTKLETGILSISILVILVVIVATTYSYFAALLTGNEDANPVKVTSKYLDIDFQTTQYINNEDMRLIKDSEKESKAEKTIFTVGQKADSKNALRYNVYFTDIEITDNLKSADLKWEILKDDVIINSGNFASIGTNTEMQLNQSLIDLPINTTHTLVVRVWLSETQEDQLSLLEGRIKTYIKVEAIL